MVEKVELSQGRVMYKSLWRADIERHLAKKYPGLTYVGSGYGPKEQRQVMLQGQVVGNWTESCRDYVELDVPLVERILAGKQNEAPTGAGVPATQNI